jgi:uncharacterized protein
MKQLPECQLILDKLINETPQHLHYHSIDHTLDVYESASIIAKLEGVSATDYKLLQIAAIYHDVGYLIEKQNHEEHSCDMARKYLPQFKYSEEEINTICTLIMATKMPQNPKTHSEEIICDADMDYLGRSDFFSVSKRLYKEMLVLGTIRNWEEWIQLQEVFLKQHHYFTASAIKLRQAEKEQNLKIIQSKKQI